MTALHGQIEPGTVGNLMQYLALSRADGRLTVIHRGAQQGNIYFEEGQVVSIEAKPFRDLAALAAMLEWGDGRFVFRRDVPPPRRTMRQQVDLLLLQVSRRPAGLQADPAHLQLGKDAVLAAASGEGVYQLTDDQFYAEAGEEVLLSLGALHLWRKLDGMSSLGQVAASGNRPVEEVVAAANREASEMLLEAKRQANELVKQSTEQATEHLTEDLPTDVAADTAAAAPHRAAAESAGYRLALMRDRVDTMSALVTVRYTQSPAFSY